MSPVTALSALVIALLATTSAKPIDEDLQNTLFELGFIDLSQYGRSIFGEPDNTTGERLANFHPDNSTQNPEELGSYLEGDILMPIGQARNGLSANAARWPNAIIPYEIRGSFDAFQMNLIEMAFNEYHTRTCIRFRPRSNERDYIVLTNGNSGCWSSVGRIGGRQEVNFQTPGCMIKIGTVIHELMHACGFLHEQNRSERDGYVAINWQNVKSGTENNFEKASASSTNAFGVSYDYGSVMHYSANAFSKNGQPTIVAKKSVYSTMGQRSAFSAGDVAKINAMYKCDASPNKPLAAAASSSAPATPAAVAAPVAAVAPVAVAATSAPVTTAAAAPARPIASFFNNLIRPAQQNRPALLNRPARPNRPNRPNRRPFFSDKSNEIDGLDAVEEEDEEEYVDENDSVDED